MHRGAAPVAAMKVKFATTDECVARLALRIHAAGGARAGAHLLQEGFTNVRPPRAG
jgi:hypothetical protein